MLHEVKTTGKLETLPKIYGLLLVVCTELMKDCVATSLKCQQNIFTLSRGDNKANPQLFVKFPGGNFRRIFVNRSHDFFFIFPQHFTSRNFDKLVAFLFSKLHTALHMTEGRF